MENKWRKPSELLPPFVLHDNDWDESDMVLICTSNPSQLYHYQVAYCLHNADRTAWINPVNGMAIQNSEVCYWREIEPAPDTDD